MTNHINNKTLIPSTADVIQLTLTAKMTTIQVVKRSQSLLTTVLLTHLDNHIPSTYEVTPGFKHFTIVEKTEDKECDFLLSVVS